MTDAPDMPLCEICGNPVDQRATGKTVNSNGRYWHGTCYKAQERIDRSEAAWAECVERLNTRADALCVEVKPLVWTEDPEKEYCYRANGLASLYEVKEVGLGVWETRRDGVSLNICNRYYHAKAAAQAHHAAQIAEAITTRTVAEVRAEERARVIEECAKAIEDGRTRNMLYEKSRQDAAAAIRAIGEGE